MAKRGGFKVRWDYLEGEPDEHVTAYLQRYVDKVDVVGGITYFDTRKRRDANIAFIRNPGPRLDLILIGP